MVGWPHVAIEDVLVRSSRFVFPSLPRNDDLPAPHAKMLFATWTGHGRAAPFVIKRGGTSTRKSDG